jgi:release factor glutamine methyltransferase
MKPGGMRLMPESDASLTIAEVLRSAAVRLANLSETPRLDAEVLLMHVLGRDRAFLRAWPERALSGEQADRFRNLVEQRAEGQPVAYLIGEREFWSRLFAVRPGVLIPRPETELLIELALDFIPATEPTDILDLGTGSGIIAVTLAAERPLARVFATDLSPEALAVARENAVRHGVTNLRSGQGDWFAAIPEDQRFDLIASNPPYIAEQDPHLRQGDVRFEPTLALASGQEGLDALRIIAQGACQRLKPGGRLLLEHGYDQADALATRLAELGYAEITHHFDLQGHRRTTSALRP